MLLIRRAHRLRATAFPQIHRDPFDRMLVSQTAIKRLVLLTADSALVSSPCRSPLAAFTYSSQPDRLPVPITPRRPSPTYPHLTTCPCRTI